MVFAAPWSDAVKKSSAQEYFGDVVRKVDELHVKKGFQYREGADAVFSAFARDRRTVKSITVPLNLVPEER